MPCTICPRMCGGRREDGAGFCGVPGTPIVAKAMLHRWEEPAIGGEGVSGAIFFAGCNMRCAYCQNHEISARAVGQACDADALAARMLALQAQGARCIDLVSPMHVAPALVPALRAARSRGLRVPIVYNTNAYERVETLRPLEGLVDIYLPDLRYTGDAAAMRYSQTPGYFGVAARAIEEMHRQVGDAQWRADGGMARGLLVRVLVLPGLRHDAMRALEWIAAHVPGAYVSVLRQYVPTGDAYRFPEIDRRVTTFEYESVVDRALALGLRGYRQEKEAAQARFTPAFGEA